MGRVRLEPGRIRHGQALAFDLYDGQGRTLLRRGFVVQRPDQLDRLIERGAYFDAEFEETSSPSGKLELVSVHGLVADVIRDYEPVLGQPVESLSPADVLDIARRIQDACLLDADPALACVQLQRASRYSLRHSFHTAVLTEVLLARMGRDDASRLQAVAGALTMNVAMLGLQDALYHQNGALTPEQKRQIVTHPQAGARALAALGVDNPIWLDVVEHHHELPDGSGYAKRLKEESLSLESQVVSLADRYSAMVSERAYRAGSHPHIAAKELLSRQAATIAPGIAATFVQEVGLYPPGTVVLLANGEMAVVVRRTLNPSQPVARALRAPSGVRHPQPLKRLTSKPAYAIRDVLGPEKIRDFDLATLWPPTETGDDGE
ncbi:HD-GYP domain-containing protein [Denitratisoma oestradiolicum]|uniref:Metal dependent phosphohydrolase n=1 Tax=Denitratisoma oestradiolicum TaxID=311182 RepID=A0A6S6XSY9_9PROT|nr:HD domain-containing phosphohydrolase [Denitratisoma oestradiolicum]TWO81152.1 hypothetical protein CBW56_05980 [Denitratisoma oestradiolicum]CAB1367840.1 Metal dependent phosphohydrolase [Denitratisoma oestradiolicum]